MRLKAFQNISYKCCPLCVSAAIEARREKVIRTRHDDMEGVDSFTFGIRLAPARYGSDLELGRRGKERIILCRGPRRLYSTNLLKCDDN